MGTNHNVLVLSAGRRVDLVAAFQHALSARLPSAKVYTTDLNPARSAACHISDGSFSAPRVTSTDYIDFLLDLCQEQNIGLVVPTIDTELLPLSRHALAFKDIGATIVISDPALVRACRDKRETAVLFRTLGIDQPLIYPRDAIRTPCFCKPYDGSRSVGAMALLTPDMLTDDIRNDEKNMFMELIGADHTEYTIDAYYNAAGALRCLVPRERIEVRDGEISKGATRKHAVYDYFVEKLGALKGAMGCITIQAFVNVDQASFKALEINPRFGGGYPLSHAAGADYPDWLIREYLLSQEVDFFDRWEADLLMLRYDAKVIARDNVELPDLRCVRS